MEPTSDDKGKRPGKLWFIPYLDESSPWRSRTLLPIRAEGIHLAVKDDKGLVATYEATELDDFEREVHSRSNDTTSDVAVPAYDRWFPLPLFFEPIESKNAVPKSALWKALFVTLLLGWLFISPPRQLPIHGPQLQMFLLLGLMMFGIMPLCSEAVRVWENWRDQAPDRNKRRWVEMILFERWLGTFPKLVLNACVVLFALVYLIQTFGGGQAFRLDRFIGTLFSGGSGVFRSVMQAALVKPRVLAGEWWRLVTAGVMHGSLLHLVFNASALYSLGRVTVAMVGSSMLGLVFLTSIVGGSLASLWLSGGRPSVGASGGVMGVLGFLVVITVLRKARIPQRYKVHLIQTIFIMIVFGVLGAQFIDNAAHGGGFLVGMFLGLLLVPRQELIWEHRPGKTIVALGWASWAVLAAACVQVAQLILR